MSDKSSVTSTSTSITTITEMNVTRFLRKRPTIITPIVKTNTTKAKKKVEENITNAVTKDAWEHILETLKYDYKESLIINSEQIKSAHKTWKGKKNQFEPRLLAYQPFLSSRPPIFKKNNLCILPLSNGEYMLTKDNIYMTLDYITDKESVVAVKKNTDSLVLNIGNSESSSIDNIRYSGILERPELLDEKITHGPLLNGRHRCSFNFKLNKTEYEIKGVQYETDACYESENKILIIEAKSSNKVIDSFNIRQLYYPYRAVYDSINLSKNTVETKTKTKTKEIIPIFIHILNDIIYIWKYKFENYEEMDSICLIGQYAYKFTS